MNLQISNLDKSPPCLQHFAVDASTKLISNLNPGVEKKLTFTGERLVPGNVIPRLFREHEDRYLFAGHFVKDRDVLDIASGAGLGTDYLRRAGAKSCLGIDIAPEAVEYSRSTYPGCRFMVGNAEEIPLPDSSIEVLVSFETIEHLKDAKKYLKECRRVLKPGGMFICSTPNHEIYRWQGHNPFHFREFSPEEFVSLVREEFPQQIKVYSQDMVCYPLFLARKAAIKIIKTLRLQRFVRRSLSKDKPETRVEYGELGRESWPVFQQYSPGRLNQPMYVVITAQKA